jgi:hypothetical protein
VLEIRVYVYNGFVFVYRLDSYAYMYITTSFSYSSRYVRGGRLGVISVPLVSLLIPTYLPTARHAFRPLRTFFSSLIYSFLCYYPDSDLWAPPIGSV